MKLYQLVVNPLLSLTNEKIALANRWLNNMATEGIVWSNIQADICVAEDMKARILKQDSSLEDYLIICPVPDK